MNEQLTDEERELAAMVRDFADTVVAPQAYEADRTHTLSMDVVAQMGDLGLFGLPFPEEYGGQGGDYMALGIAIEALGRVVRDDPGVNAPWSWHIDPATLEFADVTIEVCDGLPSYVEDETVTSADYCPWSAEVIAID